MVVGDDEALFFDNEPAATGFMFDFPALRIIHPDDLDAHQRRLNTRDGLLHRRPHRIKRIIGKSSNGCGEKHAEENAEEFHVPI